MKNGIVIPPAGIVYWYVPKCACTSLKAFFADVMGLSYDDPHAAPFQVIGDGQLAPYWHWDHIAVVRHPLDRLVSLYRDKIRPGHRGRGFPAGVDEFVFGKYGDEFREDMDFPAFARACMRQENGDAHFTPQSPQVPDWCAVFNLEDMGRLINYLNDHALPGKRLQHANESRRLMPWRDRYDAALLAEARAYYFEDLERFDYD